LSADGAPPHCDYKPRRAACRSSREPSFRLVGAQTRRCRARSNPPRAISTAAPPHRRTGFRHGRQGHNAGHPCRPIAEELLHDSTDYEVHGLAKGRRQQNIRDAPIWGSTSLVCRPFRACIGNTAVSGRLLRQTSVTALGRGCQFAANADNSHPISRRPSDRSSKRRALPLDPLLPLADFETSDCSTLELDLRRHRRATRRLQQRSFAGGHHRPARDCGRTTAPEDRILTLPTQRRSPRKDSRHHTADVRVDPTIGYLPNRPR
jgi:hypothetical protein